MKPVEDVLLNGRLGKAITRVVGKPGTLRFRLARDTVGVMAIRALSMGLSFAVSVVLARLLGVREFGLYSLAMSVLGLLVVPATFGFPQLLVREIAAYRVKGEWGLIRGLLRFAQRTSLFASLGITLVGSLVLWLLSDRFSGEAVLVLALAFLALPLWALLNLHGEALRGFEQILAGQWVSTVMRPLGFLILVGVAWLFAGGLADASLALGLHILAAGIALTFAFYLLRRQLIRSVASNAVSQNTAVWIRSALSLAVLYLIGLIPQHAGILMLGWMCGPEEVGLYKVAYQTALLVPLGVSMVNIVVAPIISRLFAEGNLYALRRLVTKVTLISLLLALPFALFFLIKGSWLLSSLFGEEFRESRQTLILLTLSQVIYVLTAPLGLALVMTRFESRLAFASGVAWFFHVVLNLILIPIYGINGVGISYGSSMAMFYAMVLRIYFRIFRLNSNDRRMK